jgi:hypothetical protein
MSTEDQTIPPRHPADARKTCAARLDSLRRDLVLAMREADEGAAERTHFYLTQAVLEVENAQKAIIADTERIERIVAEVTE